MTKFHREQEGQYAYRVTLEDILQWLETGEVDGVSYDRQSIIDMIREVVHEPSPVRSVGEEGRVSNAPNCTPAPEGYAYGYVQHSRAWYSKATNLPDGITDNIMIGLYAEDGGCRWEFAIRWHVLARQATPRVEVFDDAWQAFAEVPGLFAELAGLSKLTPEECCDLLARLGFTDRTPVESEAV